MDPQIFTQGLKSLSKAAGADLVGVAELSPFRGKLPTLPRDLLAPFTFGISVAVRLKDEVIDAIEDRPTPDYAELYRSVNKILDGITAQISHWISQKGYNALSIPASHIMDEESLLGAVSHKAIARMAGLGWQGKSLLLVTPQFGPRVRLATVLTDMPLVSDKPTKNLCGDCTQCTKACPVSAIKNASTYSHYDTREVAVDLEKCNQWLSLWKARPEINARICGLCVKACPHGKKAKEISTQGKTETGS